MQLERLKLREFRNFHTADLTFGERFTVLVGHNGAGKTNVLEAIYLVSTLRSFRVSDLGALVHRDAEGAQVSLRAHDPAVDLPTELTIRLTRRGTGARRTAEADGKAVRSSAAFYGRVQAILFTPEDLGVLRGSPTGRRQFVDRVLFARDRSHITDIQTYEKLVRSRNHVLKQDIAASERTKLLSTYEAGLAEAGARVWSRRQALLSELQEPFAAAFAKIHRRPDARALHPRLGYDSKVDPEGAVEPAQRQETLAQALQARRDEDLRRGATSVGPHRDDLRVELDGQPAATFASQGQSRALVLAFKLAELRTAHAKTGHRPLLLLDDVSSELDPQRSSQLFEALGDDVGQCVLTTTAAHFITLPEAVPRSMIEVHEGVLTPA